MLQVLYHHSGGDTIAHSWLSSCRDRAAEMPAGGSLSHRRAPLTDAGFCAMICAVPEHALTILSSETGARDLHQLTLLLNVRFDRLEARG